MGFLGDDGLSFWGPRQSHWRGGSYSDKALLRPGWQSLEPLAESVLTRHEDAPDQPAGAQRPPELWGAAGQRFTCTSWTTGRR